MKYEYPQFRPLVVVNTVVYRIVDNKVETLLAKRTEEPYKGSWMLLGGNLAAHETLPEAAARVILGQRPTDCIRGLAEAHSDQGAFRRKAEVIKEKYTPTNTSLVRCNCDLTLNIPGRQGK